MEDYDLIIAGAGIVGCSAALWAQMRGLRVLLADPAEPGSGASFGNAATLATYGCLPVNSPDVIRNLPKLLLSSDSPLALSWRHALGHPGWMLRFLANCRPARAEYIARALAALLARADEGLNPLIDEAGAQDLIAARGQLTVWSGNAAASADAAGLALRRELGVRFAELTPGEVAGMEPGLALRAVKGLHYPDARHVRDPQGLARRLHDRAVALGADSRRAAVTRLRALPDRVVALIGGEEITAARAVIAAGAWSGRIRGAGAERLPLGVERGYHLNHPGAETRLSRPTGWAEGGFYASPTTGGLRLAGTVEIAAPDAPPNPARLDYLRRRGAQMMGDLPGPAGEWLGHRPTLPDSLPVIGPAPHSDRVIHAFGHQHLGLTLAGITGRIVADLAMGAPPVLDLAAYSPARRFA